MPILESKLAKKYPKIADDLNVLLDEGRRLGATEGPQRLELISEQYDQLSPNSAYLWIDPSAFQLEIEEAQIHKFSLEFAHFFRNILSLAPLIMTWLALFIAVGSYQKYILAHPNDRTSFLQLWQSGFAGTTWFTFTLAAGIDVILLTCYLLFILLVHEMERRAHTRSVAFTHRLQGKIDELLTCVATDGILHVSDQADIDKVVDAVKKVVDSATSSVQQAMDGATDTIKQFVFQASDANKLFIDKANDANKLAMSNFEQSLKTYVTDTQVAVKLVVDTATQSISSLDNKVDTLLTQQVMPLMTDFHRDMQTLHTELGNYQGRLNDLTNASQQLATASQELADASQTLTKNADDYITIGRDISAQIGSLNRTQEDLLSQIQTVASGISTAAGNMTTATTNMIKATGTIDNVTRQMQYGMQSTLNTMTTSVAQATTALANIGPRLDQTATALYQAALLLTSIRRYPNLFPWRLGRRSSQQTQPPPGPSNPPGPMGPPTRSTPQPGTPYSNPGPGPMGPPPTTPATQPGARNN